MKTVNCEECGFEDDIDRMISVQGVVGEGEGHRLKFAPILACKYCVGFALLLPNARFRLTPTEWTREQLRLLEGEE
jgi:hypothetical protein